MSLSGWVLILFLKAGYAGGVTSIPMPDYKACSTALRDAKEMRSYQDGACIQIWGKNL